MNEHLARLNPDQRALLFTMVSSDSNSTEFALMAIDEWTMRSFGGDRERAFLELHAWLTTVREALGLPGYGRA
jgi:hypothetical protein